MPKVHLLPPDLISKIAAGEIIERPASAIKELIENALDAQSSSIEVYLKDAGKTLIQIKDTGTGIEQADLENIFLRHSTSKIKELDDLYAIQSLGFRGEALYSIAAIADVTLRSRTADQDTGWEIHLRGGKKLNMKPVAMPVGTEIEIKELFFNTPARRKFLKSDTTEMNQILDVFIPYTLLYPACRFRLNHQGKDLLDLRPAMQTLDRIADVLNLDPKYILENSRELKDKNISVRMVLGDINIRRSRRDMQFVFVNNRPVQHRNIGFHINQIYRLIFPPDNYPFFAIFIQVPAESIDVNIHPAKREIKIKDEQSLMSLLRAMCEQTLMSQGRAKEVPLPQEAKMADMERSLMGVQPSDVTFESPVPPEIFTTGTVHEPAGAYGLTQAEHWRVPKIDENLFNLKKDTLQNKLAQARYIGCFMRKFLLFELDASLLVVDQHAAQERIMFEKLREQIEKNSIEIQHLLSPVLIRLTPQELLAWEEMKEKVEEFGLSGTQWDTQTLAIHAHPQLVQDVEIIVRDLLSGAEVTPYDYNWLAGRACKSSIRTGDSLNKQQAEYQRDELLKCRDPFTCPHGRPTVIEISEQFLDKQFLRT